MMNSVLTDAHRAAAIIKERRPRFEPVVGIVLGSGLGAFTHCLEEVEVIPYAELPGFPHTTVQGHQGNLVLGSLHGKHVICLQGRSHAYEGASSDTIKTYVRTLRLLGCTYFLATNASGSLREDMEPGDLMLITDHINFQATNPLIGPNDDEFGPRFCPLDKAYDEALRTSLLKVAAREHIDLHQGVYISVMGPHYETAAEIRAFRLLGADAVGMSTVPEVLVAAHCGLRVAAIATITNWATGLAPSSHSHESVLEMANQAGINLNRLVTNFIETLDDCSQNT